MAFSIHICLFTCGGLLLEIESAPLSEKDFTRNFATMDSGIANFDADTKGFMSTLYYIIYYFVTSIIVINLLFIKIVFFVLLKRPLCATFQLSRNSTKIRTQSIKTEVKTSVLHNILVETNLSERGNWLGYIV